MSIRAVVGTTRRLRSERGWFSANEHDGTILAVQRDRRYFRVLHDSVVRRGCEPTTSKVAVLPAGALIEALETRAEGGGRAGKGKPKEQEDESGVGERVRVRYSRGWSSAVSTAGTVLLRPAEPLPDD